VRDRDVLQNVSFEKNLVETILQNITNTDNADEAMSVHHRQVPYSTASHQPRDIRNAIRRPAGRDAGNHQIGNVQPANGPAMNGDPIGNRTLGDEPIEH